MNSCLFLVVLSFIIKYGLQIFTQMIKATLQLK